jgi:hypothetical protein
VKPDGRRSVVRALKAGEAKLIRDAAEVYQKSPHTAVGMMIGYRFAQQVAAEHQRRLIK